MRFYIELVIRNLMQVERRRRRRLRHGARISVTSKISGDVFA